MSTKIKRVSVSFNQPIRDSLFLPLTSYNQESFIENLAILIKKAPKKIMIMLALDVDYDGIDINKINTLFLENSNILFELSYHKMNHSLMTFIHLCCAQNVRSGQKIIRKEKDKNIRYKTYNLDKQTISTLPFWDFVDRYEQIQMVNEIRGNCYVLLGEQGTAKSGLAQSIAKRQGVVRDNDLLEITVSESGVEGELLTTLFGAKRGDYTSLDEDRIGLLPGLINRIKGKSIPPFVIINEVQNISKRDSGMLLSSLAGNQDDYFIDRMSKKKVSSCHINWIFTSTATLEELDKKFGKAFISRISSNQLTTVPYRNMDIETKNWTALFNIPKIM